MSLASNIKELRNEKGINQRELAKEIGVAPSVIHYWENDTNEPKASYIFALANFFDVSADYLLGLSDDYRPATPIAAPTITINPPPISPNQRRILDATKDIDELMLNQILGYIEAKKEMLKKK